MTRILADARRWQREGTALLLASVAQLDENDLDAPSALPGWPRRLVIAHVAANADALLNLVRWAATGVETPMYASPQARIQGIEYGAGLPSQELVAWLHRSAVMLDDEMAVLTPDQWRSPVITAQGRTVPATETPWLRDREIFVHAVDLDNGVCFTDLPEDFLTALREDIEAKRGNVPRVTSSLADVTAWLAGRPHGPVCLEDGAAAPELGAWL